MDGNSILCGVDFSESAGTALQASARLAGRLHMRLVVGTVADSLVSQAAGAAHLSGHLVRDLTARLEHFVSSVVPSGTAWAARPEFRVAIGPMPNRLLALADAEDAALIVIGSGVIDRAKPYRLGSTAARILAHSSKPVLVTPPAAIEGTDGPAAAPVFPFTRIVSGVDFSEASDAACREAAVLADRLALPLVLVHAVIAPESSMLGTLAASMVKDRLAELRSLLEIGTSHRGPIDVVTEIGGPVETIARRATETAGTLVVLGLGTDDPSARPGAMAIRVLAETRLPVLAVPASAGRKLAQPA